MLYAELEKINHHPEPFEFYTAGDLWTDEYTSQHMLSYHLNEKIDAASRNHAFIDRSVDWIVSYFSIQPGKAIADFGCGPGLYTSRLAKHGADVTGIDFSPRSIQYAQNQADESRLKILYVNENYLTFKTDQQFDLITMIMCDFCALSPAQRKTMLLKFHSLLKPGGSVLLDVYSIKAYQQRQETVHYEANLLDGFWSPNPYYGFLNTFKYDGEKVVLDKYTIIEPDRIRTVYNWLQYFSPDALKQEFTACDFIIDKYCADVSGTDYNPNSDEFAVVAKKA